MIHRIFFNGEIVSPACAAPAGIYYTISEFSAKWYKVKFKIIFSM
uniref:Uncharacterized protein n=1 Tax=Faecalibaculum rodentium TaxID=1702221 RepID=A0A140DRN8_9FIRM|nr:hypothetical protein AALO17_01810 [Faecalibaculum rodentium]